MWIFFLEYLACLTCVLSMNILEEMFTQHDIPVLINIEISQQWLTDTLDTCALRCEVAMI